jgi:hypothetical protein
MGTWRETKAACRLLGSKFVNHPLLLSGHVARSIDRARAHEEVLAVQDTTTFSFADRAPIEGLGPVDSALRIQGFLAHTLLLVAPGSGEVVGVGHQQVWARPWTAKTRDERADQRRKRPRESEHWWEGQQGLALAMGRTRGTDGKWSVPDAKTPRIIAVFDREGDIYEALEAVLALGHGYVIRAVRNRSLAAPYVPPDAEKDPIGYSMDAVEVAPSLGVTVLQVPRRADQPPRDATLSLRSAALLLRPPKNRGRKGDPVQVNMLLVREEAPPPGVEPLCWYLLTSEPCFTPEAAAAVVHRYRLRWRIEEFHMGLKTGCGVERTQLESFSALRNLVAIASVVAWRLLSLRDAARAGAATVPPHLVGGMQLRVLRLLEPRLPANPSARDALRAIAMLGGFMGRKGDGEPGWRTLWWGYQRLLAAELGASAWATQGFG